MVDVNDPRGGLFEALGAEMRTAREARTAVPVREIGERIIATTHSDPLLLEEIVDALCTLCIRSGLTIEFSRPSAKVKARTDA